MEILPSLSDWISDSISPDQTSKGGEIPAAPTQSILSSILSAADNVKRIVKRNVSDLFTDTDNALTKTADNMQTEILAKEQLQDPAQWLSGGAGKIAGAFVGAFRPSNSKLLPSVLTGIKEQLKKVSWIDHEGTSLTGRLSDRELSRYGTTEFLLDKYLPSTARGTPLKDLGAREVPLEDFLQGDDAFNLFNSARYMARRAQSEDATGFQDAQHVVLSEASNRYSRDYSLEPDILAFRDQISDSRPIFKVDPAAAGAPKTGDISQALNKIDFLTQQSKFTPEQLSKKSLQQLLGIADSVEKEAQKSVEVITDFTKQRTAELKAKQGFKNDLVELTDKKDFGAETEFLQHCVGAGGADPVTGKFLPKWHPITGEETIRDKNFRNSAEIYWGLKERGSARYFSYRPEGLPVATVELGKDGTIKQFFAFKNEDPTPEVKAKVMEALKPVIKKMKFGNNKKYLPTRADPDLDPQDYIRFDIQNMLRNGQADGGAINRAAVAGIGQFLQGLGLGL